MEVAESQDDLNKDIADAERLLEGTTEKPADQEETKTETEIPPEPPAPEAESAAEAKPKADDEDELHGAKSHMGRIVARQVKERTSHLETMLEEIKGKLDFLQEKKTPPEEDELDLPEGATSEEIKDFVDKREARLLAKIEAKSTEKTRTQSEKEQQYKKAYKKMVEETLDPEDEDETEIYKLMTTPGANGKATDFNAKWSDDAERDFRINYRAATKTVLNKAKPAIRTTVANKPSQIPTGVNVPGGTKPAVKMVDTSKWSAEEQELAKMFSAEELAEMGV